MSLWSDLISAALVGTDRRPAPAPPDGSPLALAVPASGEPGPDRLLDLAAAVTLARRAGLPPESGVRLPAPAPAETTDAVSPAAAGRLASLLDTQPRGQQGIQQRVTLLTEWLSLARQHQQHVPPGLLPRLFEEARVRPQWRTLVEAVGGRRATWLAGHNPQWAWLLERSPVHDESLSQDESLWSDGTSAERLSYLTGLRGRDPDRARDLLAGALPTQPPATRAAWLSILEHGLSAADEAVLEPALDDRRQEVREVAVSLLASLPGSAYQRRMAARALACVVGSAGELVITPPAECDQSMRRDGVEPRPPRGTGERAWWFEQIVAHTALSTWRVLEADPSALLRRPVADGWQVVLHRGWAQATVDQRDRAWAAAFVRGDSPAIARPQRPAGQTGASGPTASPATAPAATLVASIHRTLAPADAVDIAVALLDADDPYAESVLPNCPAPWPDELVTATMRRLRRVSGPLSTLVTLASAGFSPTLAPAARQLAESYRAEHGDEAHAPFFDRLAETLTLRHQMHQEFA